MITRAEPTIRRRLIQALIDADAARTVKESKSHLGEAFAYATSLRVMASVKGYCPVGGIADSVGNYDPMRHNIERVQKYIGNEDDAREILGLDLPTEDA